nr:DUF4386 domain-containing protein [Micromonospora sp. DSM 115978]
MNSPKALARTAGVLYLILALLAVYAEVVVRGAIHRGGDAAATADNIVAHATTFRLGLVADIAMATVFVFVGIAFHLLFRRVHRDAAAVMVVFVTVGAAVILVNLIFHHAALLVATGDSGTGLGDGLALLLLDMHHNGYVIAGVFFGLWLLPLGYLAYTSGMFPRALGVVLMIGCASYLADTLTTFLAPGLGPVFHDIIRAPASIGEFWMILYLLIRGVRAIPAAARPQRAVPLGQQA